MNKKISLVIPVFNEEKNIPFLYAELSKKLPSGDKYQYEIIFIDDGSEDRTLELVEKLSLENPLVKFISFSRNFGKEVATTAGIHKASGEAAILIDADLQHPIEKIPEFLEKWENGKEVVIGVRKKNKNEGLVKKAGSFLFYKIMNMIGEERTVPYSTDFRLLDRKVIVEFNRLTEHNRITRGLIDWLGFKRDYVYFEANSRHDGKKARYSFIKLYKLAVSSFVSNSLFPLRFAGYLGLVIVFFSGLLGLFMFFNRFIWDDPFGLDFSGPASLAVLNIFLIGIVLSCLGLIALYIANIHHEVINRPTYIIRKQNIKKEDEFVH